MRAPNSINSSPPGTCQPSVAQTNFNYTDFSDVSALCFNGSAVSAQNNGSVTTTPGGGTSVLRLTTLNTDESGSVWYNARMNVASGFTTTFQFQVTTAPATTGADGFAFVIQNDSLVDIGNGGCGLGYDGIPNSLAVEFDTFWNNSNGGNPFCGSYQDPNGNHIAIQSLGTQTNSASHNPTAGAALASPVEPAATIADGTVHTVTIAYVPGTDGQQGTLSVSLDFVQQSTINVNLVTLLSLDSYGQAWVGFTAGTGTFDEYHDILSWSLTTNQPSVTATPTATSTPITQTPTPTPPTNGNLVVTNLNDSGAGSLRDAINTANQLSQGNGTITFADGLSGAILLTSGSLSIYNSMSIVGPSGHLIAIDGNKGSGIFAIQYSSLPNISISNLIFQNTQGAIYAEMSNNNLHLNITNDWFFNNNSDVASDSYSNNVVISQSLFENTSFDAVSNIGTMTIQDSTIDGSGYVAIDTNGGSTTLLRSTLSNSVNAAWRYLGGTLTIEDSTIANNGFGLQPYGTTYGPTVTIWNSTIAQNQGMGLEVPGTINASETFNIGSTIIAQNGANSQSDIVVDSGGTLASLGHNLVGDGTGSGLTNGVNNDQVGSDAALLNPLLNGLAFNDTVPGGQYANSTYTMALQSGSPAIGKGDCTNATTDQRGVLRAVPSCDVGAYEIGTVIVPTATTTPSPTYTATYSPTPTFTPTLTFTPLPTGFPTPTPSPTSGSCGIRVQRLTPTFLPPGVTPPAGAAQPAGPLCSVLPTNTPAPTATPTLPPLPPAPPWSSSHYIVSTDPAVLKQEGCVDANVASAKGNTDALIVLDFGYPEFKDNLYGAKTLLSAFGTTWPFISTVDIAAESEKFLQGYAECSTAAGRPDIKLTLAIGTNNSPAAPNNPYSVYPIGKYGSVPLVIAHSTAWADMIIAIDQWNTNHSPDAYMVTNYSDRFIIAGAVDIENWGTPDQTRAWVDAYALEMGKQARTDLFYYDYGTCDGCAQNPPQQPPITNYYDYNGCLKLTGTTHCMDYWWYVSAGVSVARPLPEIYNQYINAYSWYNLSRYAAVCGISQSAADCLPAGNAKNFVTSVPLNPGGIIPFPGVMTTCANEPNNPKYNSPTNGWKQLYGTLNQDPTTAPGSLAQWLTDIKTDPVVTPVPSTTPAPTPTVPPRCS